MCTECEEQDKIYYRVFDVTENTRLRRHQTNRYCHECGSQLRDTIVHFGEKGNLQWPLNWEGALEKAKMADCILCLGSSLKVFILGLNFLFLCPDCEFSCHFHS